MSLAFVVPGLERYSDFGRRQGLCNSSLEGWRMRDICRLLLLDKVFYQYNSPTLIDNRPCPAAISSEAEYLDNLTACSADFDALYSRCAEAWPHFVVPPEDIKAAVVRAIDKYLRGFTNAQRTPSTA